MTNPGPPGNADDPLTRPDSGTGLPEPGAHPVTSTDFALPVDGPDPLTGDTVATPPPAQPAAPLFDEVASTSGDFRAIGDSGAAVYGDDPTTGGGALDRVKAFATEKPQLFLGAALAVGFVLGRLLSSSGDDDED